MDLLNREVIHIRFGKGIIVGQSQRYIDVEFNDKVSKFRYPEAFKNFLTMCDPVLQSAILEQCVDSNEILVDEKENDHIVFSSVNPFMVQNDGLQILYSIDSSKSIVRIHFFKLDNRRAKVACIQIPGNKWIECKNFSKKEIAEIRTLSAVYANDIIRQACNGVSDRSVEEKEAFIKDYLTKVSSFRDQSGKYLEQIREGLYGLKSLAENNSSTFDSEEDVIRIFREVERSVASAEDAYRINPLNNISFFNLRDERNALDGKGKKKVIYCVELNHGFTSITKASLDTGINSGNIASALKGTLKTAGGFHWEYRSKDETNDGKTTETWPRYIDGQESVIRKTADYYMMLPYDIEFLINENGLLEFRIPDIPNCNGVIENVKNANFRINQIKQRCIKDALDNGIRLKEISDFELSKNDFNLALLASLWPLEVHNLVRRTIIVDKIEETDMKTLETVINAKLKVIGLISSHSNNLVNYRTTLFHQGEKPLALLIYEVISTEMQ